MVDGLEDLSTFATSNRRQFFGTKKTGEKSTLVVCLESAQSEGYRDIQFEDTKYLANGYGIPPLHPPGLVSFNSAISACERGKQWQLAMHFLHETYDETQTLSCFKGGFESVSGDVLSHKAMEMTHFSEIRIYTFPIEFPC